MAKKKSKIIQVPVPEELLYQLDELSHSMGESRSFLIREACVAYVADARQAELERQDREGYERMRAEGGSGPTFDEEVAATQLAGLGGILESEDWD